MANVGSVIKFHIKYMANCEKCWLPFDIKYIIIFVVERESEHILIESFIHLFGVVSRVGNGINCEENQICLIYKIKYGKEVHTPKRPKRNHSFF